MCLGFLSLDPSSGQSISQPAVSCSGTTLQVTSSVDPVSPVFAFQWIIDVGNGDVSQFASTIILLLRIKFCAGTLRLS